MAYQLIWEDNGVCIRMQGIVSIWDVYAAEDEIEQEPVGDLRYQLFDFTEVDEIEVDLACARIAGLRNRSHLFHDADSEFRIAIVAVDETLHEAYLLFKITAESDCIKVRLFCNLPDARKWMIDLLL